MNNILNNTIIDCTNMSQPENHDEVAYLRKLFSEFTVISIGDIYQENIEQLSKIFIDGFMSDKEFKNTISLSELTVYIDKLLTVWNIELNDRVKLALLHASYVTLKAMCGFIPSDHIVEVYKAFNLNAAMLPHDETLNEFLVSLWSIIVYVTATASLNVFTERKYIYCLWSTVIVQNNEIENIKTMLPNTEDGRSIVTEYDGLLKKLSIEVTFTKQVVENTPSLSTVMSNPDQYIDIPKTWPAIHGDFNGFVDSDKNWTSAK